ncbi:PEP-CTERM sorting domain-containing protein [Schlegelella sp. S2-27]|uniref:PEP-CTERM sorting domain-containing protein n=1 Tax=Caldimonas mangrovi TaxID=2944811 RepID=A0ABT0YHE6_9BURK|nr:PEP-CTERM sorting domain-containing protein [Caldimonas mangrovi]MCM5678159.1 PEP-CTERM sorting domain-containing protein [Caldimonas mangrovi]
MDKLWSFLVRPVYRRLRSLPWSALLGASLAVASVPAAAAVLAVDFELSRTQHTRLHHGMYIDVWVEPWPSEVTATFDDMVTLDYSAGSQASYSIGSPGSVVSIDSESAWDYRFPPGDGVYETWVRATQDWSGSQVVTSFLFRMEHTRVQESTGNDFAYRTRNSLSLGIDFVSAKDGVPVLTSETLRHYFTGELGAPRSIGRFTRTYATTRLDSGPTLLGYDEISGTAVLQPVPEPGTWGLMGAGLTLLAWRVGRRKTASPRT